MKLTSITVVEPLSIKILPFGYNSRTAHITYLLKVTWESNKMIIDCYKYMSQKYYNF
jgi:hypothetical protein